MVALSGLKLIIKSAVLLGTVALVSCQISPSTPYPESAEQADIDLDNSEPTLAPMWESDLGKSDWMEDWEPRSDKSWGLENFEQLTVANGPFEHVLRVHYPAGSAARSLALQTGTPEGGVQLYGDLLIPPQTQLKLTYYVRFAEGFDFVKGGKLPGLFGGTGPSGGNIPDGTDGFSTRLMWRRDGQGEVYAYLPSSKDYGTSIGAGAWQFQPGIWYKLEQELKLNTPNESDGELRLWVNDQLVIDQQGLLLRTVDSLKIDGIFFSTFFGGGDSSWATPQDTYTDFANFSVSTAR